jgi:hypothetical protein
MDENNATYAPQAGESAEAYKLRLAEMPSPNPHALKAARLVATAMEENLYNPNDKDPVGIDKAFASIVGALEKFDKTSSLANADDRLMDYAIKEAARQAGANRISSKAARKLIGGKAGSDVVNNLLPGISEAWSQFKEYSPLMEEKPNAANASNKKAAASYMDQPEKGRATHNPLSQIVSETLELRDTLQKISKRK